MFCFVDDTWCLCSGDASLIQEIIFVFHILTLSKGDLRKKFLHSSNKCHFDTGNGSGSCRRYLHNSHMSCRWRHSYVCSFCLFTMSHHISQSEWWKSNNCLMTIRTHLSTAWIPLYSFSNKYRYYTRFQCRDKIPREKISHPIKLWFMRWKYLHKCRHDTDMKNAFFEPKRRYKKILEKTIQT